MLSVVLACPAWLGKSRFVIGSRPMRQSHVRLAAGVVNEDVEIDGQRMTVERYVEADVGMTFPKIDLTEALFSDPTMTKEKTGKAWPDEYPFPPAAFRRQDENDDEDFYSFPRLCYHVSGADIRKDKLSMSTHLASAFCIRSTRVLCER